MGPATAWWLGTMWPPECLTASGPVEDVRSAGVALAEVLDQFASEGHEPQAVG
jgi:hypothetical protein